jgi:hypothetical protein
MRGDLQCNTIFFQPKGWKTAGRLHRSHQTIFQSFDGRSVLFSSEDYSTIPRRVFPSPKSSSAPRKTGKEPAFRGADAQIFMEA